ncbi:MAG: hypothetical protein CM1200mP40_34530 [Gammaproteobacteria bacterium]|nr:MAG: hypothetical protein CM1200mP40_34530 [Gammaproteobacteria bacterium]
MGPKRKFRRVRPLSKLTHIDPQGRRKWWTWAIKIRPNDSSGSRWNPINAETMELIAAGGHKKGDVLSVARIAGIQAAKNCSQLIPLCHPLMLTSVDVDLKTGKNPRIEW